MAEKIRIFISYARADGSELANRLFHDLKANDSEDFEPWLDQEDLRGGDNWEKHIESSISRCLFSW